MTGEHFPLGPVSPRGLYHVKTSDEGVVIARETHGYKRVRHGFKALATLEPIPSDASAPLRELYDGLVMNQQKVYEDPAEAEASAEQLTKYFHEAERELGNKALVLISSRASAYVSAGILKGIEVIDSQTAPIVGRYSDGRVGTLPRHTRIHTLGLVMTSGLDRDTSRDTSLGPRDAMDYDFRGSYRLPEKWSNQ